MERRLTFVITDERYNRLEEYLQEHTIFPSMTHLINYAIDYYIDTHKARMISDFIYYIGFPFGVFLGFIFLTFYLKDVTFYVLTAIVGFYLIILIYLYYDRYLKNKGRRMR